MVAASVSFKQMMRKQWLVKKRRPCLLCCEIVAPIIFFVIIIILRMAISTKTVNTSFPEPFPIQGSGPLPVSLEYSVAMLGQCPSPNRDDCAKSKGYVWTVTTSDSDISTNVTDALKNYLIDSQTDAAVGQKNRLLGEFRPFSSEQALFDYIEADGYLGENRPPVSVAVVLNAWDNVADKFDYTVRVHEFALPLDLSRDEQNRRFAIKGNPGSCAKWDLAGGKVAFSDAKGAQTFACTGFLSWQMAIDQFVIDSKGQPNNLCTNAACNTPLKWNTGALKDAGLVTAEINETAAFPMQLQQMPYAEYLDDSFFSTMATLLPTFFTFAFIFPFSFIVKQIVEEKSLGLKEGLRIVGLTDGIFWASWCVTYVIEFFISAVFLTIVMSTWVFTNSSGTLLFFWMLGWMFSMISFACLLSTFFSNPKTSGIMSFVIFWAGFIIASVVDENDGSAKRGLSLFPQAALTYSSKLLAAAESAQIGIVGDMANAEFQSYTFSLGIAFMYIDTVLFAILTWYFDKVLPSKFGSPRPWYFLFKKSFWTGQPDDSEVPMASLESTPQNPDVVEQSSEHMVTEAKRRGVHISGLHKRFQTPSGPVHAVNNLSLDMFPGQVFGLLGHNGAGKTTTISMLCGVHGVTSGEALIGGRSVKTDMANIRNSLGVCPQHNILWPRLTVVEHLELFARLKNVPEAEVDAAVQEKLVQVGLTEKADSPTHVLSGGQKRKVCVAMALIGKCDVVFLDEPTSGMDPYSRRATWNLINQCKKDRVIVLTTHFMDEADILADRIAIMAHGQLQICGTSLFLKQKYGVGYNMTLSKNADGVETGPIRAAIANHIPDTKVLSDVGKELALRVPLGASPKFPDLLDELDEKKAELGLDTWGLSVTTLEEVFLKIAHAGATMDEETTTQEKLDIPDNFGKDGDRPIGGTLVEESDFVVFFLHVWALLIKRFHIARRDIRGKITNWALPLVVIMLFLGLPVWLAKDQADLGIQLNDLGSLPDPVRVPTFGANYADQSVAADFMTKWQAFDSQITSVNVTADINSPAQFADEIFKRSTAISNDEDRFQYAAVVFNNSAASQPSLLMINTSFTPAWPVFVHQINNVRVRTALGTDSVKLRTAVKALPRSAKENNVDSDGFIAALWISMTFAFIPAATVFEVVRERQIKAKHQQLVSGVSQAAYWCSTLIWDLINYMPVFLGALIVIAAIDVPAFTDSSASFSTMTATFFLFGLAVFSCMYLLSFLFTDPGKAQISIFLAFFLIPFLLMAVFFLEIAGFESATTIRNIGRVFFPSYALGDSLMYISRNYSAIKAGGAGESYTAWNVAGGDLFFLGIQAIVYLFLAIVVEYASTSPKVQQMLCNSNTPLESDPPQGPEDEDVVAEKERVLAGIDTANDLVQLKGFRKVWGGKFSRAPTKVAVKDMYFSIPEGECFGFLGVNGAGKTTTLSMLSGEHAPSAGSATIAGLDVVSQQNKCRRLIGYCPQFDALFPTMTTEEHLYLYARIKGVERSSLASVVNNMIDTLQLTIYKDKPAGTLSGGNKRKLSVAMALIGSPKIVFLDEPSTGVDPVARRWMWNFISRTMAGRSVILTTHSMDECEALCQRIGIMVSGRLKCLGTAQHLKQKFGQGYQLDVKATELTQVQPLLTFLSQQFPGAVLLESHDMSCKVRLPAASRLADIFRQLESKRGEMLSEYSVSQTTLEQIFIGFARDQLEETQDIPGLQTVVVEGDSSPSQKMHFSSVNQAPQAPPPQVTNPNQVELQAVSAQTAGSAQ